MSAFCDTCQKSFYSNQTLQRHKLKAHGDKKGSGATEREEDETSEEETDEEVETDDDSVVDESDDSSDNEEQKNAVEAAVFEVVKCAIDAKRCIDVEAWKKCQKLVEETLDNSIDDD